MNAVRGTFFMIGWRYLIRRPWQTLLMVLGITLGVAVVIAVDLANESASRAFDLSTDAVAGRATHQITGSPEGLDEEFYADLRKSGPGVPLAPVVASYVTSPQLGDLPMQLLGIDPFVDAPFRTYLGDPGQGAGPDLSVFLTQPGAILISQELATRFELTACNPLEPAPITSDCTIELQINGFNRPATIVGLLDPPDALSRQAVSGLVLADIATAQELTGKIGVLSSIDVILPDPSGCPNCENDFESSLPEGVLLQSVSARNGTIEQMTAAFRLNLTALSLLALVVGLFLIYNTMTFSVVKRRSLFGTLRCLGVSRREVFLLVVSEALVIGMIGSLLGALLGILLGQEAVRMVTQTVNDLYFVVTVRGVRLPVESLVKGFLLGIFATTFAAAFPAREAATVPPRAALSRSGLEAKAGSAVRLAAIAGLVAILSGGVLLFVFSSLGASFTGTFTIVIGFAALTPATTRVLMRFVILAARKSGLLVRMAPRNVVNALSRTSIAVAALMVAVSVTIGISLMVSSFRETVVTWLGDTLQGDVYISTPGVSGAQAGGVVVQPVLDRIEERDDIERIDTIRVVQVDSTAGLIGLGATNNPIADGNRPFAASDGSPNEVREAMKNGALIISEPLARRLGIPFEGGALELQTPGGLKTFPVAAVYYDYGNTQGLALMDLDLYQRIWGDMGITAVSLNLIESADPEAVTIELQDELVPLQQLLIQPNRSLRDSALVVFDRTFAITSALQGLATIVAFIGVLSALLSLQLEKAREFGILRAIGLTARQLRRLVLIETGLMGSVAGLLSMPTGFVLSLILIYIINRRAFGWTLQLEISALPFFEALGVAVVAALLAGLYPAIRLSKMAPADALREE